MQIRNRAFLKAYTSQQGNMDKCYIDLARNRDYIFFNGQNLGQSLKPILADNLNKSLDEMKPQIISFLAALFRELLSKTEEEYLPSYSEKLAASLYQWGLLMVATQAFTQMLPLRSQGGYGVYAEGLSSTFNIYQQQGNIYIEEQVVVHSIYDMSDNITPKIYKNSNNQPLLKMKSRCCLQFKQGVMSYEHTDLVLDYDDDLLQSMIDTRSLLEKIKDFLKVIFRMNSIENFSLDALPGPKEIPYNM